jgi:hypothetical protein
MLPDAGHAMLDGEVNKIERALSVAGDVGGVSRCVRPIRPGRRNASVVLGRSIAGCNYERSVHRITDGLELVHEPAA